MAMQVGMGLSRVVFLIGAGFTGSFMMRNGRLSDILGDLQDMVKGLEKSGEKGDGADGELNEVLASQVRRLAMEVRQLASSGSITVLNGSSAQTGITALIVPAATLGALGYGYMWWKGFSFSDLMYVTKRNMATAVSSMTKHLEQVSAALAATKRHLTQRIENLDGKLDEQKEMSTIIKKEVIDARKQLENMGSELSTIQQLVWNMDGKVNTMVDKQNFSLAGVMYLCQFVEGKSGKMPDFLQLQDGSKPAGKRFIGCAETTSLKGLQHITEVIESGKFDKANTDVILQNDIDSLDNFKASLSRTASAKC